MPDRDTSRIGGELVPLRAPNDDGEIGLESPRLEALTAGQEAEAVDPMATLFAAAAHRRVEPGPLKEAA